jgi:hypothetical protein
MMRLIVPYIVMLIGSVVTTMAIAHDHVGIALLTTFITGLILRWHD